MPLYDRTDPVSARCLPVPGEFWHIRYIYWDWSLTITRVTRSLATEYFTLKSILTSRPRQSGRHSADPLIFNGAHGNLGRYARLCVMCSLHWRHNGRDSFSNHKPHECLRNRLFRRRSKKTSQLRVTGLCVGNSSGTGEFPAQMASNAESVSFWWRHHVTHCFYGLTQVLLLSQTYPWNGSHSNWSSGNSHFALKYYYVHEHYWNFSLNPDWPDRMKNKLQCTCSRLAIYHGSIYHNIAYRLMTPTVKNSSDFKLIKDTSCLALASPCLFLVCTRKIDREISRALCINLKTRNTRVPYPTMHHIWKEMCTCAHFC